MDTNTFDEIIEALRYLKNERDEMKRLIVAMVLENEGEFRIDNKNFTHALLARKNLVLTVDEGSDAQTLRVDEHE